MQITWSAAALRDLAGIREYIADQNSTAADRQIRRVITAISRLLVFPRMGRAGRVAGTRELVVQGTPYIVAYRVGTDHVVIARVLHARQRWPARL